VVRRTHPPADQTRITTRALENAIRSYVKIYNEDPKPFIWHKTADEILASIANYCQRISDSGHYSFGRADLVDRAALERLVGSVSRFLDQEPPSSGAGGEVEPVDGRDLGGAWVLDRLWERLGIGKAIVKGARGRRLDARAGERALFALVASRALAPSSKLEATRWVREEVYIESLGEIDTDSCYRAMDSCSRRCRSCRRRCFSPSRICCSWMSICCSSGLNRYLRVTKSGLLRIDKAKVTAETALDGKYLLRTSDPSISAEDVARGYKALAEVERGWRDMKQLELRPIYHRRADRIVGHVQLCWLALLLIRTIENQVGDTWRNISHELDRMQLITLETATGTVSQRTRTTARQRHILDKLGLNEPPRYFEFTPTGD
jgi:hypothetical protein